MSGIAIRVEGLSKRYRIGPRRQKYKTLRETLSLRANKTFSRDGLNGNRFESALWALKDVYFEIKCGEVVGIIGRNGAGKSTLLKVLSRITEPTEGYADIYGRVGSLLEVGIGFHPELTGRENIQLNGSILGMKRNEIARKFDEIVDFSEIEKFIDTPVKHYSSGMYLRLAFGVTAHLEPEILMVDELLAVGDAAFQKKCLGKMSDVAQQGRTVLFVSHNLAAIRQLCSTSLLFEQGKLKLSGPPDTTINSYLNSQTQPTDAVVNTTYVSTRGGTGGGRILRVSFIDEFEQSTTTFGIGKSFTVSLDLELPLDSSGVVTGLEIKQSDNTPVLNLRSDSQGITFKPVPRERFITVEVEVPGLPLYPGRYLVEPWFADRQGRRIDQLYGSLWITLESQGVFASEMLLQPGRAIVLADCNWRQSQLFEVSEELVCES